MLCYFCQKIAVSFKVHEITEHVIGLFVSIMSSGAEAHRNMVYKVLRIISRRGQLCDNHDSQCAYSLVYGIGLHVLTAFPRAFCLA